MTTGRLPDVTQELAKALRRGERAHVATEETVMALRITPSERHALQLLANGYSGKEVAAGLRMGLVEAEVLLTRLFTALGAATEGEAIAAARKRGLVSWEERRC